MPFGDFPVANKIVLITGGGSGIGLCLAEQSVKLGAKVLIADLRLSEGAQRLVDSEKDVIYSKCDVTNWKDFEALFAASEEKWGDVPDVYSLCAGLFEPPFSNFWQDPETDRYTQVDVNVSHPIKVTRMAIRACGRKNKKAVVCIIASIAGIAGNIAAPLYCATKHATVGFVKSMSGSDEFTGVKVTTILPGLVDTPLITKDKATQFSFSGSRAITPGTVASSMLDLIQDGKYPCGTVYEVSTNGTRVIPEWNVDPPSGAGTGQDIDADSMTKAMIQPILDKLESDKASKL